MYKKILLSILLALSLSACSGNTALTAENNGERIQMKTGDTLQITLESNPTTGYQWTVFDMDETILAQVGEAEYRSEGTQMAGAGGEEIFTFKALASGETVLSLGYHRDWEEGIAPVENFAVTVIVE